MTSLPALAEPFSPHSSGRYGPDGPSQGALRSAFFVASLRHTYKDRKAVAAALKQVYRAKDAETGKRELQEFADGAWGRKYPAISQSWQRNWTEVIPFFAFPDDVRRLIYTTNAIEALNAKLRRAVRARGHFPTDEAALKLLYLVLNLAEKEWKMPPREWTMARAQLAILFEERFRLA